MSDIVEQLGNIKTGDYNPDDLNGICDRAIEEIARLRAQVFGQGARLDQLHSIVGAAMAEPLVSFAEIKKEIRNG